MVADVPNLFFGQKESSIRICMAAWKEVRSTTVINQQLISRRFEDVAVFYYDPMAGSDVTGDMRDKVLEVQQNYCRVCPIRTCSKVQVNRIDHTVEAVAPPGTFTDQQIQAKCS